MIDGRKFFNQLVNNILRTYDNIQQITAGHVDDYITYYITYITYITYDYKNYYKIIEEVKGNILDFLQGTVKVL